MPKFSALAASCWANFGFGVASERPATKGKFINQMMATVATRQFVPKDYNL